ncbi:OLC1v1019932C1 [Oldenlandia corymbosa var. corymbosa]|uniref:OLC1v1019932C1 n=1 Tax=Oldenlandia corymbosa var. corymbosa TaxID=529605 RepID=A0AAV1EF44_OLDCO|nr:OLC1v1019932C1 [Oldenlandia corymbosa var. corymbosa]
MPQRDVVTCSAMISICYAGLVEKGLSTFKNLVQEHGAKIGPKHYSYLVDLLARARKIDVAVDLVEKMSQGSMANPGVNAGYLLACNMYAYGGSSLILQIKIFDERKWRQSACRQHLHPFQQR